MKDKEDKGKEKEVQEVLYDYHDGSISSIALRSHLLGAHELFQVLYLSMFPAKITFVCDELDNLLRSSFTTSECFGVKIYIE